MQEIPHNLLDSIRIRSNYLGGVAVDMKVVVKIFLLGLVLVQDKAVFKELHSEDILELECHVTVFYELVVIQIPNKSCGRYGS